MANLVIASFASNIQQNCAWAQSVHFTNADGSDFDLTPFSSLTFQVRATAGFSSTPLVNGVVTVTSAVGGVAVVALSAQATSGLPANGQTFEHTTPVWGEVDGILTADPNNPICLAHANLQVVPGGNARPSTGTAPTVPLATLNLVVGAVSAAAARQMIGINGTNGLIPAAQLPSATPSAPGAAPYWPQTVANNFDPSVTGLAADVGAIVVSVDTTKSWKKYGATDTNWVPLHVTSVASEAEVAAIDVPLYCEQAGGFRFTWSNVSTTVAAVRIQVRVNGTALAHTVCHAFQTREQGGSPNYNNYQCAQLNSGAGGFAINFGLGDSAQIELECMEPRAAYGTRYILCRGTHLAASGETFGYNVRMRIPTGNVNTVGIESFRANLDGTGRLSIGTRYRLERFA